jgi:hypothetical protein
MSVFVLMLLEKKNSRLHVTSTFAHHFTALPIVRQPSGKTFPNMPGTGGAADSSIKAAVRMMKVHPTHSLPCKIWMCKVLSD